LVVNETRVIRARLRGKRIPGAGAAEVLLLHPAGTLAFDPTAERWLALVRPGQKLRPGRQIAIGDDAIITIEENAEGGARIVRFSSTMTVGQLLERHGEVPLPPYIGEEGRPHAERYQTVFARVPGSVAAPTASLHFTDRTFDDLQKRGVELARIVLDVGIGTFRPILSDRLESHPMHAERYEIPAESAAAIERAREEGRRIIAAGTTVVRTLEAAARFDGHVHSGASDTDLYIVPGFRFQVIDAMLTNFHLPRSTLLVLITAFAGYDAVRHAYEQAIISRYRFFSFGDAMFIESRRQQ
jgi:S-adenosylmethionine:tRNA ribosyltransferase-isomerase